VSILALTDGRDFALLPASQDHKPLGDGDTGPNTGGMGAFCPVPAFDTAHLDEAVETIIEPTLAGLAADGLDYCGVLYFGLMLTAAGPRLLEYNVRLGDPETEVVLPALASSLLDLIAACLDGEVRRASETKHPDLFWAVRGGGGNFGVVTSFEFRAHPVGPDVWFSVIIYPAARARRVMRFAREFITQAPEELMMLATFWMAPEEDFVPPEHRGSPAFIMLACYHGPVEKGEQVVRPLREAAESIAEQSGPRKFIDVQKFFDADYPNGMFYYWKSLYLDRLDDEVMDALNIAPAR
jgi:hypothetical protein